MRQQTINKARIAMRLLEEGYPRTLAVEKAGISMPSLKKYEILSGFVSSGKDNGLKASIKKRQRLLMEQAPVFEAVLEEIQRSSVLDICARHNVLWEDFISYKSRKRYEARRANGEEFVRTLEPKKHSLEKISHEFKGKAAAWWGGLTPAEMDSALANLPPGEFSPAPPLTKGSHA